MIVLDKSLFRFRYVFGLFFAVLLILFIRNLISYIQFPNTYLAGFLPGLRPDYFLQQLTGIEFLIIVFTFLTLLLVVVFIALSFWFDRKTDRQEKQKMNAENQVIPIIISYVYQDLLFISESLLKDRMYLKASIDDAKTREVFFVTIVHFQELVEEDISGRLRDLCIEIKAIKGIEYLLRSIKDGDAILGLRVVRTLNAKEFLPYVNHYIHSKNSILRIEAILTKLRITVETDPEELFSSHPNLSPMDINRLLPEFRNQVQTPEILKRFLESKNSRINALGVILLKSKLDVSLKKSIKKLLEKKDPFLRMVIWDYLTTVAEDSDEWFFTAHYWSESNANKIKILSVLGRFTPSDIWTNFLDKVIRKEESPFKVLALEAIFKQDIERFLYYMDQSDSPIEKAYDEVINLVN